MSKSAKWWAHEGALSWDDGHYGAAATAYAESVKLTTDPAELVAREYLRDEAARLAESQEVTPLSLSDRYLTSL